MQGKPFIDGRVVLHAGDCLEILTMLPDASVDSVVTDPPYGLSFMGKGWDHGVPSVEIWQQAFRVLKPGGHLLAFFGTRTYHRGACAIEDAGFEVRDSIYWHYGSGFPKSHDVGKKLDAAGQRCSCGRETQTVPIQSAADGSVCSLWQDEEDATGLVAEGEEPDVLSAVQRHASGRRVGQARAQGCLGTQDVHAYVGCQEPGMEGRGDLPQATGQLRQREICEVPARSTHNGTQGRLCYGTPPDDGALDWSAAASGGVRPPQRSQPAEQRAHQSGTVALQSDAQASGAWPTCGRCGKPIIPDGLGTALKPATEPIVLARKPLIGTVSQNVLQHGTGALNIDGCRVTIEEELPNYRKNGSGKVGSGGVYEGGYAGIPTVIENVHQQSVRHNAAGRWPANLIHDGSEEVLAAFPDGRSAGDYPSSSSTQNAIYGARQGQQGPLYEDVGSAARFFYTAKADAEDRLGSKHPTVKPLDLMQWLVRLVTPKGGVVLDPFAGTGTTGEAAWREGMRAVLIEREPEYQADIARRMELAVNPTKRAAVAKTKNQLDNPEDLPLFASAS